MFVVSVCVRHWLNERRMADRRVLNKRDNNSLGLVPYELARLQNSRFDERRKEQPALIEVRSLPLLLLLSAGCDLGESCAIPGISGSLVVMASADDQAQPIAVRVW
uniref:Uncharacterized protein n=1 Tax=Craspedostauros australis TaxID=1486917 RepID=A0A7R9WXE4_9STRA